MYNVKMIEYVNTMFGEEDLKQVHPLQGLYLDYANNFQSLGFFADHYEMSTELAQMIIKEGRRIHEMRQETLKVVRGKLWQ